MVREAQMSPREAYSTFNMGCGFAVYCRAGSGKAVVGLANALELEAMVAGEVENGPRRIILPNEVVFEGSDMDLAPRRAA
jgi:phosphoribosylformylglycinamidine cyclo-ligase